MASFNVRQECLQVFSLWRQVADNSWMAPLSCSFFFGMA
jgi:hypothetical protein